jgi:hypothetical protein
MLGPRERVRRRMTAETIDSAPGGAESLDEDAADDFDDPVLRMFAAAPPVPLGPAGPAVGTVIAQSYCLERRIGAACGGRRGRWRS